MEIKDLEQILDNEFLEKLIKATTDAEIKNLLKEKGLNFSDEQIVDLKEKFVSKLKDELLSSVSGGKFSEEDVKFIKDNTALGASNGVIWGMSLGALAGVGIGIAETVVGAEKGKIKSIPHGVAILLRDAVAMAALGVGIGAGAGAGIGAAAGYSDRKLKARGPFTDVNCQKNDGNNQRT